MASYGLMLAALLLDYYSNVGTIVVFPTQFVESMRTVGLVAAWFLVVASRSRPTEARDRGALGYATFFWLALPFCFMGIIALSMMMEGIRSADYLERR